VSETFDWELQLSQKVMMKIFEAGIKRSATVP